MRGTRTALVTSLAVILIAALGLAGCGSGSTAQGGTGTVTVSWYTAPQPGRSFQDAAAACTKASNGKYRINVVPLPSDASQQREQLVRRLAAKDSSIDIISMDVVWTAEFAEAKWVVPWPHDIAAKVADGVIPAVLATGRYKGRMYAGPLDAATQLLWYRKDLVPTPPTTWAEMIRMTASLPSGERAIEVQAAKYEGLTVWFNSLLASAGGQILTKSGKVSLATQPTRDAMQVMRDVARAPGSDPSISNNLEDDGRLAFQAGRAAFMVNYPFVDPAIKAGNPKIYANMGVALWPRVDPNQPAHVSLGGFNLGVGAYSNHKSVDFAAAQCLQEPAQQVTYAKGDGLAPISQALYQDPRIRKAFPYADLLLQTLQEGSTRPVSPAYNDISLAVQDTLHPPGSISPRGDLSTLRSRVDDAINSRGLL
jgi:multiple sugar transport system substrate-binding protein